MSRSPGGFAVKAAAVTSSPPSPCFDPATPAMPRAPVDGAGRAHKAARRLPLAPADGAEALIKEAAAVAAVGSMHPATQLSPVALDERGVDAAAAPVQQHRMQLDAAASGDDGGAAQSEQELPLCVMRPVVNLPYSGKMPTEAVGAMKPQQGQQPPDAARAQTPGGRTALRGSPGRAVISLGGLSGKAAEQVAPPLGPASPAPSLLDQLCAEVESAETPGSGLAAMEVGPPCKTSPAMTGMFSAVPCCPPQWPLVFARHVADPTMMRLCCAGADTSLIRQLFAAATPMAPLKAARPQAVAALHGESASLKVRFDACLGMQCCICRSSGACTTMCACRCRSKAACSSSLMLTACEPVYSGSLAYL